MLPRFKQDCGMYLQSFKQLTSGSALNSGVLAGFTVYNPKKTTLKWTI